MSLQDEHQADKVLPSRPNLWGEPVPCSGAEFISRWLPGAFGAGVEEIGHVYAYTVEEDEWETRDDGIVARTIKRATVVKTFDQLAAEEAA